MTDGPFSDPDAATRTVATAAGEVPVDPTAELPRGATVGRYVVLGVLGAGGMGRVYQAADPELDRRIALKLVHGRKGDATAQARLLREAQALAQLAHPNVVTVFDAGRFGEAVYLAMELVEGQTLRQWLKGGPRSRDAVLDVMVAAGRGLAAAHRAGIVHRDFKPANVILGDDGRVRVLDFGIARAELGAAASRDVTTGELDRRAPVVAAADSTGSGDSRVRSSELTRAGARLGTPMYMAPEQHAGADVDARADQFAFCVVLYEALRGMRPFEGKTIQELGDNVRSGRTVEPIAALDAPGWLRAVIGRGLSPEPSARFASMEDLLAELTRDRSRFRRRAVAAAVAVVIAGGAATAGVLLAGDEPRSPCAGVEAELAGAWDAATAASVRAGFIASGRAYAADTAARVERVLDAYADEWTLARREACEATVVRGEQTAALMERRFDCLGRRRDKLAALTSAFSSAPNDTLLEDAIERARDLPAVADCGDDEALLTAVPLPDDPTVRERIADLRARLDAAEASALGGDVRPALDALGPLVAEAQATAYAPLVAEALFLRAELELEGGDPRAAEQTVEQAIQAAAKAKDDHLIARAWTQLINILGDAQARPADALALRKVAEAALTRADAGPLERADLLDQIGNAIWAQAKYADARALHQEAYDLRRTQLPADDPRLGVSLNKLAGLASAEGRMDEARRLLEQALAIRERAFGAEHPDVATIHTNLGTVAFGQGDLEAADRYHRRALTITERAMGRDHLLVGVCANNLADVARRLGHHAEARQLLERAEAIFVRALGKDHPNVATTVQNLGELALAEHRATEARALFERALAGFEAAVGKDHPYVAYPLTGLGTALVEGGQPAAAIAPLERALAIRQAHETPATDRATTTWALARALHASGRDRRRARALAIDARATFAAGGAGFAAELAAIDAWLVKR